MSYTDGAAQSRRNVFSHSLEAAHPLGLWGGASGLAVSWGPWPQLIDRTSVSTRLSSLYLCV